MADVVVVVVINSSSSNSSNNNSSGFIYLCLPLEVRHAGNRYVLSLDQFLLMQGYYAVSSRIGKLQYDFLAPSLEIQHVHSSVFCYILLYSIYMR